MSAVPNLLYGFSYGDYELWPEDKRCELIDGQIYDMSPAPSAEHQRILLKIAAQLDGALAGQLCKTFIAPFDVRLPENDEPDETVRTVVQPDISVICDPKKLDKKGCRGAPDLIIEILSPHTSYKDQSHKLALYERHGVREYWTIHPEDKVLTIRLLGENGKYGVPQIVAMHGIVSVTVLACVSINFDEFITWGPFYVMENGPEWYYPYGGCERVQRGHETNVIRDTAVRI